MNIVYDIQTSGYTSAQVDYLVSALYHKLWLLGVAGDMLVGVDLISVVVECNVGVGVVVEREMLAYSIIESSVKRWLGLPASCVGEHLYARTYRVALCGAVLDFSIEWEILNNSDFANDISGKAFAYDAEQSHSGWIWCNDKFERVTSKIVRDHVKECNRTGRERFLSFGAETSTSNMRRDVLRKDIFLGEGDSDICIPDVDIVSEADVIAYKDFLLKVVCAGYDGVYDYLIKFLQILLVNTGSSASLVLTGQQGVGKSLFAKTIGFLLNGSSKIEVSLNKTSYNDYYLCNGRVVEFADTSNWRNSEMIEIIKQNSRSEVWQVSQKYTLPYTIQNNKVMIITSNNVRELDNSDRRILFLEFASKSNINKLIAGCDSREGSVVRYLASCLFALLSQNIEQEKLYIMTDIPATAKVLTAEHKEKVLRDAINIEMTREELLEFLNENNICSNAISICKGVKNAVNRHGHNIIKVPHSHNKYMLILWDEWDGKKDRSE